MNFENFGNNMTVLENEKKPDNYQKEVRQNRIEKQKERLEKSWEKTIDRFSRLTSMIDKLGNGASVSDIRPALMEVINLCEKEVNEGKTDRTATLIPEYADLAKSVTELQMNLKQLNLNSTKLFAEGSLQNIYKDQIAKKFNDISSSIEAITGKTFKEGEIKEYTRAIA